MAIPYVTTGELMTAAMINAIIDAANGTNAVGTPTTTGTQNALAIPAGLGPLSIYANNATLLTINGLAAGVVGQLLTIHSVGTGQIDLANQSGSATAANRIITGVTGPISLAAGIGRVSLQYDGSRWRVLGHEQGAVIIRTFAAGNYLASAGNWTVASATTDAYYLRGRQLHYEFVVSGTTSATPITLNIVIPGSVLAARVTQHDVYFSAEPTGGAQKGYVSTLAGGNLLGIQRVNNAAIGTGTVTVGGSILFDVT
jgi:hypothetical protein